ncbi:alpha/beta fold hydrolase [Nibribacter ruber]|uniref:Alpha/beta fold hydrolase n=1 Tax=Nibribacter ruber TaxID=2698458 RepID=A0A6P1P317_9BACT|nr:alpha/beta hydrolase [Nibribacter ruber]QHL88773.1 alpha/beta fold hydrolase [Nibribacter ruber]
MKTIYAFILNALCIYCLALSPITAAAQATSPARETRLTMSDGTELYVKVSGKGRPCVFIHGGPGAWSHSFEVLGLNTLEDSVQMIYVDQRGSGRSGKAPNGNYSLQRMTQDFDEVRQQLGYPTWTVLAHSFGGILATEYAYYFPKTISRMILLNATLHLEYSAKVQIQKGLKILKPADPAPFVDEKRPYIDRFMAIIQALNEKNAYHQLMYTTPEGLQKMNEEDAKRPPNYAFGQVWANSPEYFQDFTEVTRHLKMPVLVISGEQDFSIGPDHYKSFKFPNQTVASMPGGHVIYLEQNAQFQKAVKEFLKKTSRKI